MCEKELRKNCGEKNIVGLTFDKQFLKKLIIQSK